MTDLAVTKTYGADRSGTPLRMGTRGSALAMAQSGQVAETLTDALNRPVDLIEITTQGDLEPGDLTALGGTGVFATALREAVLGGEVDAAVHSLKDLPTAPYPGLTIAAIPRREDPRDVLVSPSGKTLGELPNGATIGTGSPRRAAQLRALGLGHEIVPIRGNVDTRIRKANEGEYDAVVLARAGLARLGRLDEVTETLDPIQVLPAPGQGALAVETRIDDVELTASVAAALDHAPTRAAVTAERALLAALEAGCSAPVGALADWVDGDGGPDELYLRGVVAPPDGSHIVRLSAAGPAEDPEALGRRLAEDLLAEGAGEMMGSI